MNIDNSKQTIDQLKKLNPEFQSIIEKVNEENRLILSRFTHELRNPLTLIRSTIQLIESQHPEAKDFMFWNQLLVDIDDTVGLLNELSLYNHCDELQLDPTNLPDLIRQTIHNISPYASTKNVTIDFTLDEHTSHYTSYACDRIKMKELLTNIIKNATEAADEHSIIQVSLSLKQGTKTNGHYINLSITNSGIPIPTENLSTIFDPFVTFKSNGTGLGLAISQKIAMLHRGTLSVSQTENTVTFSLELPMNVLEDGTLPVAL